MTNLNILKTFRTKGELVNYFKENGQNITEEEIEALKKSYEQAQEIDGALSLQQLDNVAGGVKFQFMRMTSEEIKNIHTDTYRVDHPDFCSATVDISSYNSHNDTYLLILKEKDKSDRISFIDHTVMPKEEVQNLTVEQFNQQYPNLADLALGLIY